MVVVSLLSSWHAVKEGDAALVASERAVAGLGSHKTACYIHESSAAQHDVVVEMMSAERKNDLAHMVRLNAHMVYRDHHAAMAEVHQAFATEREGFPARNGP